MMGGTTIGAATTNVGAEASASATITIGTMTGTTIPGATMTGATSSSSPPPRLETEPRDRYVKGTAPAPTCPDYTG